MFSQRSDKVDNLFPKLYAMQLNELSIPEYIQQIKITVGKIKASGETLTDRAIIPVVLKGLPDEEMFRTFKDSGALLLTTEKILKNLYEKLLAEEERLREITNEGVFVAKDNTSRKIQESSVDHASKDKYWKKKGQSRTRMSVSNVARKVTTR